MTGIRRFLGIDLGGGRGKTTAVAVLERRASGVAAIFCSQRSPAGRPWYDDELYAFLQDQLRHHEAVVAVDAPVVLPACLRCTRPSCPGTGDCDEPAVEWMRSHLGLTRSGGKPAFSPYTQRVTDLLMEETLGLHREALGTNLGPVAARMQHLLRRFGPALVPGRNLLEVWPRALVASLFGHRWAEDYRKKPGVWTIRAHILESLSEDLAFEIWREDVLSNVHLFDALLCAYAAYLWDRDEWRIPEALAHIAAQDGWNWPPVAPDGSKA